MADNKPSSVVTAAMSDTDTVEQVALQLFAERSGRGKADPREIALQAFRDATVFTQVSALYRENKMPVAAAEDPRAICFAPNLKKTHPYNLVSRQHGNLNRVAEIFAELDKDKSRERYEELEWDEPTTSLARTLFPAYLDSRGRARQPSQLATAN